MKVLVSGMGIAGPTVAFWLARHGIDTTLVEKAPALRTGGYIIDFWGAGYDIAERMGILPTLHDKGYRVQEVRFVDGAGRRVSGFPVSAFDTFTKGRFVSLPRGDLAATIYDALPSRVEQMFGDQIRSLEDDGRAVQVDFERAGRRAFDLVIGADGLHSDIRAMVFGEPSQFERYLGYKVAAVELAHYPHRDELAYVMRSEVGQQVGRFTMRNDRTLVLFVFTDDDSDSVPLHDIAAQQQLLARRFGNSGWECNDILKAVGAADALYFDRMSQVRMPRWTKGRVALVGDAAFCVSLLAGQGSALAMIAAYVLAGELAAAGGDHEKAFAAYNNRLGTFIRRKQDAALQFAGSFAPSSRLQLFVRNQVMKLLGIPFVAKVAIGRSLVDKIELPDYGHAPA
ncbi:MAG: FAD-binding domain [Polyangiaceae bacterium]|nr:FAD-binding domain [Polyangiaceae bacterium]